MAPASGCSSAACSPRRSGRRRCPTGTSRLRLAVMATHTKSELREAARRIAALPGWRARPDGRDGRPPAVFDGLADAPGSPSGTRSARGRAVRTATGTELRAVAGRRGDRRRRCAALGERVSVFKPAVTGLTSRSRMAADHELLAGAAGGAGAREVAPYRFGPPSRPTGGRARRRADRSVPAAGGRAPRTATCWSPRASAACSFRSRPATWCATSRVDLGLPVVIAARPGSARSTTRC